MGTVIRTQQSPSRRRRTKVTGIAALALLLVGIFGVATSASSGWFAPTVSNGTVSAGTVQGTIGPVANLTVTSQSSTPTTAFTVSNPGTADVTGSLAFTVPAGATVFGQKIKVWEQVAGSCSSVPGSGVQTGVWDTFTYTGLALSGGASKTMCMQVVYGGVFAKSGNYSFTGNVTLTNAAGNWTSTPAAVTATVGMTGASREVANVSGVSNRTVELSFTNVQTSLDVSQRPVTYKLFRSTSSPTSVTALGTEVRSASNIAALSDALYQPLGEPQYTTDTNYWYTVVGYDAFGDIVFTTASAAVKWPWAIGTNVLIKRSTSTNQCWQAAGTSSGSLVTLQTCNAATAAQRFQIERYVTSFGDRLYIRSVSANLYVTRALVASATDNLVLGAKTTTSSTLWNPYSNTSAQPSITFRNDLTESGNAGPHCVFGYTGDSTIRVDLCGSGAGIEASKAWTIDPIE